MGKPPALPGRHSKFDNSRQMPQPPECELLKAYIREASHGQLSKSIAYKMGMSIPLLLVPEHDEHTAV